MLTKGDPADKSYYRPTNTLPNFSKIFEKLMFNKSNAYTEIKLSESLMRFRTDNNTQHTPLRMIQILWPMLNKRKKVGQKSSTK